MQVGPEDLLGLREEGYRLGFYNQVWRQTLVDIDSTLYRLRVMAFAAWREKPAPGWTVLKNAPVKRYEAPNLVIDGKLYVIGGFSGQETQALTRTDIFDPATSCWSPGPALPIPITHVTPATFGGEVWIAGGYYGDHPGPSDDVALSFEPASSEWRRRAPLPTPTASAMLVEHAGRLHAIGGYLDRDATTAAHWVLAPDGNKWEPLAPMKHPRGHHTAVSINGRIYVFGGQFQHDTNPLDLAVVEAYDAEADRWDEPSPMPAPRSHVETSTIVRDGRVVLLGGLDRARSLRIRGLPDVVSYDPTADRWCVLPPLPIGLIGPTAKVIGDKLYLTGGMDLLRPGAAQAGTLSIDAAAALDPSPNA